MATGRSTRCLLGENEVGEHGIARSLAITAVASALLLTCLLTACAEESSSAEGAVPRVSSSIYPVLTRYKVRKSPTARWKLPKGLNEVSGLAAATNGRLFAHDDERAVIYEISVDDEDVTRKFRLGPKKLAGDFEGITIAEGSIFLVTSDGTFFQTPENADGERVAYVTHSTGIGDICEIEGLGYEPLDRSLLLACKKTRGSDLEGGVAVFRWSLASHELSDPGLIWIPSTAIEQHLQKKSFHPSGIVRHPLSGTYFILSAREHAVLEVTATGEIVGAAELKRNRHPHAEGIAILIEESGDYTLLIGDEGDDRRARITSYRLRDPK